MKKYINLLFLLIIIYSLQASNIVIQNDETNSDKSNLQSTLPNKQQITIQQDKTPLRTGPGILYPIKKFLNKETILEIKDYNFTDIQDKDNWFLVSDSLNLEQGFISLYSTKKIPIQTDKIYQIAKYLSIDNNNFTDTLHLNNEQIALSFTNLFDVNSEFIDFANSYNIDINKYIDFKKDTYLGFSRNDNFKNIKIPNIKKTNYFTEAEIGLGLGIASIIAKEGLYYNKAIQDYINYIGIQVVEAFSITEVQFKFFILNQKKLNSYACPGGYIFISKGLLLSCENEAELAFILAQEIAQVIIDNKRPQSLKRNDIIVNKISLDSLLIKNQISSQDSINTNIDSLKITTNSQIQNIKTIRDSLINEILIYKDRVIYKENNYKLTSNISEIDEIAFFATCRTGYDGTVIPFYLNRLIKHKINGENYYSENSLIKREIKLRKYQRYNHLPKNLMKQKNRFDIFKSQIKTD
ncbi:MAG: M48 family metalloprotease [Candidatus Cloacimonetes bacterium]|jgi:hypothetical protein|nr:M48 family metalloprotease [Candidatus Cloacimonadota bacterium]